MSCVCVIRNTTRPSCSRLRTCLPRPLRARYLDSLPRVVDFLGEWDGDVKLGHSRGCGVVWGKNRGCRWRFGVRALLEQLAVQYVTSVMGRRADVDVDRDEDSDHMKTRPSQVARPLSLTSYSLPDNHIITTKIGIIFPCDSYSTAPERRVLL